MRNGNYYLSGLKGKLMFQYDKKRPRIWITAALVLNVFFFLCTAVSVRADVAFTKEELTYIDEKKVVKAISIRGIAPIIYQDENGDMQGVSPLLLKEISVLTGLTFEYELYDSLSEALESDYDIFLGAERVYAPKDMLLSDPYLESKTILCLNSSIKPDDLSGRIFAAVRGGSLPDGVKEENTIYYSTREECLDAVNSGKADYSYGNSFSVLFYTLHKNYNNIVMVPIEKESRNYCIGISQGNSLLLSIINKSLNDIDKIQMEKLTLEAMAYTDRNINPSMLIEIYGGELFAAAAVIFSTLLFLTASYIKANKKLKTQNLRYEQLSSLSNEYLYEYFEDTDCLNLSEKCIALFQTPHARQDSETALKEMLLHVKDDGYSQEIILPLSENEEGVFRAVNSCIFKKNGEPDIIIGKLLDISAETAEKERLLFKSQADGLTGLYNAATTKEFISKSMQHKSPLTTDAFLLLDCDNFKNINDTYGHLAGDQMLIHLSDSLRHTFRSSDILGRIGGDEFIAYLKDIPSTDFVRQKCSQLNRLIKKSPTGISATVCIGIVFVTSETTYDTIFQMADHVLYQAKSGGKNQFIIYNN